MIKMRIMAFNDPNLILHQNYELGVDDDTSYMITMATYEVLGKKIVSSQDDRFVKDLFLASLVFQFCGYRVAEEHKNQRTNITSHHQHRQEVPVDPGQKGRTKREGYYPRLR